MRDTGPTPKESPTRCQVPRERKEGEEESIYRLEGVSDFRKGRRRTKKRKITRVRNRGYLENVKIGVKVLTWGLLNLTGGDIRLYDLFVFSTHIFHFLRTC